MILKKLKNINFAFMNATSLMSVSFGRKSWGKKMKVTDLSCLFSGCVSLTHVDLSSFDTSNVVYFGYMFNSCEKLKTFDLSSFDTRSGVYFNRMFYGCHSLTYLYINSFNVIRAWYLYRMFGNCYSLYYLQMICSMECQIKEY